MSEVIPYRFRLRRGLAATWASTNPVPLDGEISLERDTGRYKIGDGVTAYNDLLYACPGRFNLAGLADGYVPKWDAANSVWVVAPESGGGGAATVALTASEAIPSNSAVNMWMDGATQRVRLADSGDRAKPCNGWVTASVASGDTATVALGGLQVTGLSGLAPGARVLLAAAGAVSASAPSGTAKLTQPLGFASSASAFWFSPSSTLIWTP